MKKIVILLMLLLINNSIAFCQDDDDCPTKKQIRKETPAPRFLGPPKPKYLIKYCKNNKNATITVTYIPRFPTLEISYTIDNSEPIILGSNYEFTLDTSNFGKRICLKWKCEKCHYESNPDCFILNEEELYKKRASILNASIKCHEDNTGSISIYTNKFNSPTFKIDSDILSNNKVIESVPKGKHTLYVMDEGCGIEDSIKFELIPPKPLNIIKKK